MKGMVRRLLEDNKKLEELSYQLTQVERHHANGKKR
jgi:hypothetical protein